MDNKKFTPQQILNEAYDEDNGAINIQTQWNWGNWVETDIWNTAWGISKVSQDYSLFHWLWTYDVPATQWLIEEDWVETQASTRVTSVDSQLQVSSWATSWDTAYIESKRHPRYQPNRWHLYSTAWFMPNPTDTWIRRLGLMHDWDAWAYFELTDWILYAVIKNDWIERVKEVIDLSLAWITIADLQYWTLYDIQFQWRWVWDYFFYVNQVLVYKTSFLGANIETTIFNPAMSASYYSENTDWTEVAMRFWCVDITSEWGTREWLTYLSVANATPKIVSNVNTPAIIIRIADTLNTIKNTRDVLALRITWSSDQKSFMKAFVTRDATAITWASFIQARDWSWVDYDVSATAIDTAKCQLLWNVRTQQDNNSIVDLPSSNLDFPLIHWDYLIITMHRENETWDAWVVVTVELWEEI